LSDPKDKGEIIPLSRWRAALARARRGRRAEALLEEPDAAQLIPQIPVQDLYYAIKEVGLADAYEVLALATPEQVRGFLDLDIWERDHLDETRMNEWLEALVEAGFEKLGATIEGLDPEVIALWLQRQAWVYDLTIDEIPEDPQGHYYPTPDRFFLVDVLPEGEAGKAFERVIEDLYRADLSLARRIMMGARWEMASDLEEHSYRWRTGRMADMGYAEYYDALSVYQFLDPASVQIDENTQQPPLEQPVELPVQLAAALDEKSFFARALSTLTEKADIDRLQGHLMVLLNRVMAADRVPPSDVEGARLSLERSVGYLAVSLEFLAKGDPARGGRALLTIALERVFRVGVSLTLQLQRLAEAVWKNLGLLLDPPFDATVAALRQRRPQLADGKFFREVGQIRQAASALEEAAEAAALIYDGLGVPASEAAARIAESAVPEEARFGTLLRTLAAHLVLEQPPTLTPLSAPELAELHKKGGAARDAAFAKLREVLLGRGARPETADRWLARWRPLFETPSDAGSVLQRLLR
jgi:hypothetical protein